MIWKAIAWLVTRPRVRAWIIRRAMRTPYTDIRSRDGKDVYMRRYWLFNPYDRKGRGWFAHRLPSVRAHHILLADDDPHRHDHPWGARTIIMERSYMEQLDDAGNKMRYREEGYTGPIRFGQYPRIHWVSEGGVWTLFITWRYIGTWGFLVDGKKVPYREYFEGRDNGKY